MTYVDERDRTLDEVEREPLDDYEDDYDREPCGENMCHCHCPAGHVCGCDCWRCADCGQNEDHCQCDEGDEW